MKKLHNEEWFELFVDYREQVTAYGDSVLGITPVYHLFLPLFNKADLALVTLRKSVYTKAMEDTDKKRDLLFKGFAASVKADLHHPNASKQEAAERLHNLVRGYQKTILEGNYVEESGAIYNLLGDLATTQYAADATLLGLNEWVTALAQTEQAFRSFSATREEESFAKPKEDLQKLRAEIDTLYTAMLGIFDTKLLTDGLGGDVVVNPEDLFTEIHEDTDVFQPEKNGNVVYNFVVAWNETLKKYRNLLQQRAGRQAKKEEEDSSEPVED